MNEVVAPDGQMESALKCKVSLFDRIQIDILDQERIGDDLLGINDVDQRLGNSHFSNNSHVESVNFIPPVDLLVLVLSVFDCCYVESASVWEPKIEMR